jgi:hypothetical protein
MLTILRITRFLSMPDRWRIVRLAALLRGAQGRSAEFIGEGINELHEPGLAGCALVEAKLAMPLAGGK